MGTAMDAREEAGGRLSVLIVLVALALLMLMAYRGFSVILFAPLAALLAVVATDPRLVLPFYSGVFMERVAAFLGLYFPVFLLGAVFGKLIEAAGFARSIIRAVITVIGAERAIVSVVIVCGFLTYGGVSLFVVAFAVYPFAAELFRAAGIPKRLIPGTIALGAFTFTMDALPGSPQIQNIIPTTFFHTDAWAAPWLGLFAAVFVFAAGLGYLDWRRRCARASGEGYGDGHSNEPALFEDQALPHPAVALIPLVLVALLNKLFSLGIGALYDRRFDFSAAGAPNVSPIEVDRFTAIWAVEGALFVAILCVVALSFRRIGPLFHTAAGQGVAGAMLAALNTGSEYGFGAVISLLPGFKAVNRFLIRTITNPLLNVAVTTNVLAGITGSASGGMSIVLASMGEAYLAMAQAHGISPQVLHRITSLASGGMDTLPHNGAVITLLAITGLTHRQAYGDIFAITLIKVTACFAAIAFYLLSGIY